jgi:3D (Asp-Asp-Asp) domain-containing protein
MKQENSMKELRRESRKNKGDTLISQRIATVALTASLACSLCAPLATPILAAPSEVKGIRAAAVMSLNSISNPVEEFVTDLYTNLLNREPDNKGLISWTTTLQSGQNTASSIVAGFVRSREFQERSLSVSNYISVLYRAILGRKASEGDIDAWRNAINNGSTRMKVLEGLLGSREFKSMCDRYGIQTGTFKSTEFIDVNSNVSSFIARLYLQCLGRKYDDEGLLTWVTSIVNGTTTGTDAARGFMLGHEINSRGLSNTEFIKVCYRALLNREPDEQGLNSWLNSLKNGMSRNEVVESFIWCDEFVNYCNSRGIKLSPKPVPPKTTRNNDDDDDDNDGWRSLGTFKITAYCPCSKCNGTSSGITYSGTRLTVGRTVAVSKSVIPLGSVLKIEGVSGTRVAEDTGVSGRTIDLLVSSHSGAYEWGVRYREVWIKD